MNFPQTHILVQSLINLEWSVFGCVRNDSPHMWPELRNIFLLVTTVRRKSLTNAWDSSFTDTSFLLLTSATPATSSSAFAPLPRSVLLHPLSTEVYCVLTKAHFQLYLLYPIHKADLSNRLCTLPVSIRARKQATNGQGAEGIKGASQKSAWKVFLFRALLCWIPRLPSSCLNQLPL